jgi:hypothetical protein
MSDAQQTLTDTSLMQNETHTTMTFIKPLAKASDLAMSAHAQNTLIYAARLSSQLGLTNTEKYFMGDQTLGAVQRILDEAQTSPSALWKTAN